MTDSVYKFLNAPYRKRMEIRRKEKIIEELRLSLLPRAIQYDKDKVQSSPEDQLSKVVARIDQLKRDVERLKLEHLELVMQVNDAIEKLDDDVEKVILIEWYIERLSARKIMKNIGYSKSSMYRHKRDGVKKLDRILKVETV